MIKLSSRVFELRQVNLNWGGSDWPLRITIGLASVSSLWLLGIPPISSVVVLCVIGALTAFGRAACSWVGLKEVGIGVGLIVGSGFLVLSSQLLLVIGIPALLVHSTMTLGMLLFAIFRQKRSTEYHFLAQSTIEKQVFFSLAIALLILAVRHPWLLFFAVPIVILERLASGVSSQKQVWVLLLPVCGFGLILAKQVQPTNWWYYYQGNDAQFFEAIGFTLAEWGIFSHPGNPGSSIAEYHWFAYAFFGQLTRLANLASWDALLKVGPLLIPFFVLMGSFVYPVVLNRLDRISRIRETVGDSLWQVLSGVFPYFIVFLLLIAVKRLLELNWSSFALKLLSVTTILALIGGLSLDRARRVATWGPSVYTNWTFNDSPFPSDLARSVGQYIRNNTSPSVVLASNDFCCFGEAWWDKIREDLAVNASDEWVTAVSPSWWQTLKESPWGQSLAFEYESFLPEAPLWQQLADIRWGGDNYHLSAESRRRFLLLGLKFQTGGNARPTPDQILRMTLSLQFANNPTASVAEDLKGYGVSGYVVNLSLTDRRDWSEFAVEKFRNSNFAYLELR